MRSRGRYRPIDVSNNICGCLSGLSCRCFLKIMDFLDRFRQCFKLFYNFQKQVKTPTQVFSSEIFENFKSTYFEEHLGTTLLRKISPLLVYQEKWLTVNDKIEQQMLFTENINLIKLVCVIFALILSSWNKLSRKYSPPRHISHLSLLTGILTHISPLKRAFDKSLVSPNL